MISTAEKAFDQMWHSFIIKTFIKVSREGVYINIIKAIYDKPTANITPNGEKLKAFLLFPRTRQGCWYVYICMCVYVCIYIYMYMYVYVCVYIYVCVCICVYVGVYIYIHTHHILLIHWSINGHLACFHVLTLLWRIL